MKRIQIKKMTVYVILAVFLVTIILSASITMFGYNNNNILSAKSFIEKYKELETDNTDKLAGMWRQIDKSYNDWIVGEIDRKELAKTGLLLLKELEAIENSYSAYTEVPSNLRNNKQYSSCTALSESLRLKTRVMLFDLVRGFDLEGNPYNKSQQIDDETLRYVYEKRKKNFENEVKHFLATLNQL